MPTYTFIKERSECGNIEGCKFVGDTFRTNDDEVAERLRKSATFGKTVNEITETETEKSPVVVTEEQIKERLLTLEPEEVLEKLNYLQICKVARELGLPEAGTKKELIAEIENMRNEHQ